MKVKKVLGAVVAAAAAVALCGGAAIRENAARAPECETRQWPVNLLKMVEPAEYVAKAVWGEARAPDKTRQAAVVWCVLNRVDRGWGDIVQVVTCPHQFAGYHWGNPVEPEIYDLVLDVFARWDAEKAGCGDVGRVLPKEYLYFSSRGGYNYFRMEYDDFSSEWQWEMESPYEEAQR